MTDDIERVALAIDSVRLFSRFNDWTTDRVAGMPIEICCYGKGDEDEIVVVERFPANAGQEAALMQVARLERARAALAAMPLAQIRREAIEEAAVVAENVPLMEPGEHSVAREIAEAIRALAEKP